MTDFFLIICVNLFNFLCTFFQMFKLKLFVFYLYQNIVDTTLKILNIHVNFLYYDSCILLAIFFFKSWYIALDIYIYDIFLKKN